MRKAEYTSVYSSNGKMSTQDYLKHKKHREKQTFMLCKSVQTSRLLTCVVLQSLKIAVLISSLSRW